MAVRGIVTRLKDLISTGAAGLADRMASPILARLNARAKWWRLGRFPLRSHSKIGCVHVGSQIIRISVPEYEKSYHEWEFNHLYGDDPYRLAALPRGLHSILDVGGNVGFFSILARHYFPAAVIHSYEPAPEIFSILKKNTKCIGVVAHNAGVASCDGHAEIVTYGPSLYNRLRIAEGGQIRMVSIKSAMALLGGTVDLLKLDCEGGEWDIFQDRDSLERVKYLAMEYHLVEGTSLSLWELVRLLKIEGFEISSLMESDNRVVGLLTARNLAFA
jgi:FkbM family methyltransferase